jgi:diacylglycerol kinase family enzyme
MGTGNVIGLDFALSRRASGTLAMIERGRTTALDVARVNGRHLSFLVTGIGFDACVARELERRRTGPITKLDWTWASLRAWWSSREARLEVEVDGGRLDGDYGMVLASNVIHYAGFKCLAADRRIDDGAFDIYLFRKGSRAALAGYALQGFVQGFPGRSCTLVRARRVRVSSREPVPFQVDGDYRGETPVDLEVTPHQYRLVIP